MKPYIKNGWLVHQDGALNLRNVKSIRPQCGECQVYTVDRADGTLRHKYETVLKLITKEPKCRRSSKGMASSRLQEKRAR